MEKITQILIYIHAILGGIALISGIVSISVKKGANNHKKSGKIFSVSILLSAIISLIVARMPNHENIFLFLIGIFTIYMVLSGNRALTLKSKIKTKADFIDKTISGIMLLTSAAMIIIGIMRLFQKTNNHVLFFYFGGLGSFLSLQDFKTYNTFTKNKNAWIKNHIGRMVGALIASITAFIVAGLHIGTLLAWLLPSILGTIYIIYWTRKFKSN